jgi:hypothetical protein
MLFSALIFLSCCEQEFLLELACEKIKAQSDAPHAASSLTS